jgi:predicted pyridoxine 5'-phosphate oxidase superfamily flavin-nucleotide-binding protein
MRIQKSSNDGPGGGVYLAPDMLEVRMSRGFLDVAVTPSVRAAQAKMGVAHIWEEMKGQRSSDRFTENEKLFIADRDSFYMATVSETDWPYIQHRGGTPGFLKMIDDRTLAFGDYRGNRQYISAGNLAANDRACLFLMDYPRQMRLKIYAHVETLELESDPSLTKLVTVPKYRARMERVFRLRLEAFDWNCPQHITPRFTEREIDEAVRPLRERLVQLEAENAELRSRVNA